MNHLFEKTEQWIRENHAGADHLIRTVFWLKKIYPQANEAMKIAAVSHDMERAFPMRDQETIPDGLSWKDFANEQYLLWHGKRSAEFLVKYLKTIGATDELMAEVEPLVTFHEIGGTKEQDIIKDADSVSFLEVNAPKFIADIPDKLSKEEAKIKFDYMYDRISSDKARKLAKPFYIVALKRIENL